MRRRGAADGGTGAGADGTAAPQDLVARGPGSFHN